MDGLGRGYTETIYGLYMGLYKDYIPLFPTHHQ